MILRKIPFVLFMLLFYCNASYSEDMMSEEAVNYYNEGVNAQKAGKFQAADVAYQKTLLIDPYNPAWQKFILNNRGVMYAREGDLEEAERAFKAALKIDPKYKSAQLNLGIIYDKYRSRLEALEYWTKLFALERLKPKGLIIEESK